MVYIAVLHVTGVSMVSLFFYLFFFFPTLFTDSDTELLWKVFGVGKK